MRNVHGGLPGDARVVIVGASLAGLRTAEALRDVGHDGPITIIGDDERDVALCDLSRRWAPASSFDAATRTS